MEMEPSAAVWNNIKAEVSGKEVSDSKRSIVPFLQIAAGVIVLVSVALILRPQTEKVALHGDYTASVVTGVRPSVITPQTTDMLQNVQVQDVVQTIAGSRQKNSGGVYHQSQISTQEIDTTQKKLIANVDADIPNNQTAQQQIAIMQPYIPSEKSFTSISSGADHIKPIKALAVINPPALKDNNKTAKKKIRNLGDLLNVMIAKVDKRDKKIIEFNDEDDDDTLNPTHINLGLIQTRKDN
jgi:hypothetical protein